MQYRISQWDNTDITALFSSEKNDIESKKQSDGIKHSVSLT